MSTFQGIDIGSAPLLIDALQLWSPRSEDVLASVSQAETLSALTVGIHGDLARLGIEGPQMSSAVHQALDRVLGHRLELLDFAGGIPGHAAIGLGQAGILAQVGRPTTLDFSGDRALTVDETRQLVALVDELNALAAKIGRDVATGGDVGASRAALDGLLGGAITDGANSAAAASMLLNGLPAEELPGLLSNGASAALADIALAMELGMTPAQAQLHPAVFPSGYVEWHNINRQLGEFSSGYLPDTNGQAYAEGRTALLMARGRLSVATLDHDIVIGGDGVLSHFDAVGAAAATLDEVPGGFVGDAYANMWRDVSNPDFARMATFLGSDAVSALGFVSTLGPEAMGSFLDDVSRSRHIPPASKEMHGVVENFSRMLSHASTELPAGYATSMIQARPVEVALYEHSLPPELLFSHGIFDRKFIAEAAATSLQPNAAQPLRLSGDPRIPILTTVLDGGHTDALVLELANRDDLNALLFPPRPIDAQVPLVASYGVQAGAGSLWAALVGQAARSREANAAVVEAAAVAERAFERHEAQMLSALMAEQLTQYIDGPSTSSFLQLAGKVFAAGEGRELDAAVRTALLDEFAAGFSGTNASWWDEGQMAGFAGRIDVQKYFALQALTHEEAERLMNSSASGDILTGLSVAHGVFGTFGKVAPQALVAYGVTGIGLSAAPWLLPMNSTLPPNVAEFYNAQLAEAYNTNDRGQAIALWSALVTGAVHPPPWFSVTAMTGNTGPHVLVIAPAGTTTTIEVTGASGEWVDAVLAALPDETTLDVDGLEEIRLRDAIAVIGTAAFDQDYSDAMEEGLGG